MFSRFSKSSVSIGPAQKVRQKIPLDQLKVTLRVGNLNKTNALLRAGDRCPLLAVGRALVPRIHLLRHSQSDPLG